MELAATLFTAVVSSVVATSLLGWLLQSWLGKRIEASIEAEYAKKMFLWEAEQRRREKAQLVAELLAEWSSHANNPQLSRDERKRLNQLSYEASLWLPEDISRELSKVLQHDPSAMNPHDLLLRVRVQLSGEHNLTAKDVTVWKSHHELPNRGVPEGYRSGIVTVTRAQIEVGGAIADAQFDLNSVCALPKGATLHLTFRGGRQATSATATAVQTLVRLPRTGSDSSNDEFLLKLFPPEQADELNRQLAIGPPVTK